MMAQQGFRGVAALLCVSVCLMVFVLPPRACACIHRSAVCTHAQMCPSGRVEMFDFCSLGLFQRKQTNLQSCQDGHHLFTRLTKSWVRRAGMKG